MPAADDVLRRHHVARVELAAQISLVTFRRRRRIIVERDVSTLRADHDLIARGVTGYECPGQRTANSALRPLAAIVDRAVDDVDAFRDRPPDCVDVGRVVCLGIITEVGTDADRRLGVAERTWPEEVGAEVRRVPSAVARRGVGRCETWDYVL